MKRETGYRNIQVYFNEPLVYTIGQSGPLMDGIKVSDDELGNIKFAFSVQRPHVLEIKVNNNKYKKVNKLDLGYNDLIAMFSTLAVMVEIESRFKFQSSNFFLST